ncbi:MAG: YbaB/EbfC family nucleoid-associated protein [Planctomycetota bacterium]
MFKGLGNLANLMMNARNLGGKMEEVAKRLREERVIGTAGGQMVTVHANGLGQVTQVVIDPNLKCHHDRELLQDLLPAAINEAVAKAKQLHIEAMKEMTGGVDIPGLDQALQHFT